METLCISLSSSTVSSESGESHVTVMLEEINNLWQKKQKKTGPVAQKGHIVCEISHKSNAKTQRWRITCIQLRNKLQN